MLKGEWYLKDITHKTGSLSSHTKALDRSTTSLEIKILYQNITDFKDVALCKRLMISSIRV